MLAQSLGGVAFCLISATFGVMILGMAANAWHQLRKDDYRRIAIAAAVLVLSRLAGALMMWLKPQPIVACQEWALESLTLAVVLWAFMYTGFGSPRRASLFLGVSVAATGLLLSLCAFGRWQSLPFPGFSRVWFVALLLLSSFALVQWARHRPRFSAWLGSAFLLSSLGAVSGLLGFPTGTLLGHLAVLPLLVIETYGSVLTGFWGYRQEFRTADTPSLQQTQEMIFLLEVSQAITASLDLVTILERVSESVARALNADWAYVLLPVDGNPEQLRVAARYGWWGRRWIQERQLGRRMVIGLSDFSLIRHAVLRRRQVLANRPEDYEQFGPLHDRLARPQSGPTLIQPMHFQDRALGVLILGRVELTPRERGETGRGFGDADAALCQTLAEQAAAAIHNARQYESVNEQAQRLSELLRRREREIAQRQAILESVGVGVIVTRESGELLLVNAVAEHILGVPREQLLGPTIKHLFAQLLQTPGQGSSAPAVFKWGEKKIAGSLAPVKMPGGTWLGYVAVLRDVTSEQQAEAVRADWIATISHELGNWLTSIGEEARQLATQVVANSGPALSQFLDRFGAQSGRMAGLVNNLTVMSEIDGGTVLIEPQPVDMRNVIQEAVQSVRSEQEAGQLKWTINVPANLDLAWGDPLRLRLALENLLVHAVSNTPGGGRIGIWATEAFLEERDAPAQKYLVVSVRDSGKAVLPEEQDRILEKLYRVDPVLWGEAGGAGLELAVSKGLVEAHGGRIWVESRPGAGTTFSFTIPTASDKAPGTGSAG